MAMGCSILSFTVSDISEVAPGIPSSQALDDSVGPDWGDISRPIPNCGAPFEEASHPSRQESFDDGGQRARRHEREQDLPQGRPEEAG